MHRVSFVENAAAMGGLKLEKLECYPAGDLLSVKADFSLIPHASRKLHEAEHLRELAVEAANAVMGKRVGNKTLFRIVVDAKTHAGVVEQLLSSRELRSIVLGVGGRRDLVHTIWLHPEKRTVTIRASSDLPVSEEELKVARRIAATEFSPTRKLPYI